MRLKRDPVMLNVGGMTHSTSIETINNHVGSLLFHILHGSVQISVDPKGAIFIDRDGAMFRHVLNFMRLFF